MSPIVIILVSMGTAVLADVWQPGFHVASFAAGCISMAVAASRDGGEG